MKRRTPLMPTVFITVRTILVRAKFQRSSVMLAVYAFIFLWVSSLQAQARIADLKPTLILISIDGFRADYLTQYKHATLDVLGNQGVRAKWMTPSYPSLTFPN